MGSSREKVKHRKNGFITRLRNRLGLKRNFLRVNHVRSEQSEKMNREHFGSDGSRIGGQDFSNPPSSASPLFYIPRTTTNKCDTRGSDWKPRIIARSFSCSYSGGAIARQLYVTRLSWIIKCFQKSAQSFDTWKLVLRNYLVLLYRVWLYITRWKRWLFRSGRMEDSEMQFGRKQCVIPTFSVVKTSQGEFLEI